MKYRHRRTREDKMKERELSIDRPAMGKTMKVRRSHPQPQASASVHRTLPSRVISHDLIKLEGDSVPRNAINVTPC